MLRVQLTNGFIDLHCHVLAGIDDGPAELDGAVALVEALASVGFAELHPTPHQRADLWAPDAGTCAAALSALRGALQAAGSAVEVRDAAGENMWDELFAGRQENGDFPSYVGGKAFLLELAPDHPPPQLAQRLFDLRVQHRRLPVLAHVERYHWAEGKLDQVGNHAALLVNLGTLGGQGGWWQQRAARRLVRAGLIHAIASDAHEVADIAFCERGARWIEDALGKDAALRLLRDHPQRILDGDIP